MSSPFRFGVVATPDGGRDRWIATARRVEELGYTTLLMPDGMQRPGPSGGVLISAVPALAMAAGVTEKLRVGTFVMASPLRAPMAAAWDAHSLGVLTGGRFDLGIGTGLPSMKASAERLGQVYGDGAERLARVEETIARLRELDGETHTRVLMAAGGPKSRALAARVADVVTLATKPLSTRDEVAAMAADVRAAAGERADSIEFAMNLFVVGDEVPAWTRGFIGADAATLIEHDSLVMLRGSVTEMCDELQRRRDAFGTSYISVNGAFFEQLAPVVAKLSGQ